MKFLKIIALLAFSTASLYAQNAEELFRLGCNSYASEDYAKAESYFAQAAEIAPSAGAYYNLACSARKLGDTAKAELFFMRAIYADPRLPEAKAALELLRKENSLPSVSENLFDDFFDEMSQVEWTWTAAAMFWLAAVLFVLPPLYGKRSAASIFLFALAAAAFVFSTLGILYWKQYSNIAVALVQDTALRLSPAPTAPVSAVLQPAQLACVEKRKADFIYVKAAGGKSGWAMRKDLAPVK